LQQEDAAQKEAQAARARPQNSKGKSMTQPANAGAGDLEQQQLAEIWLQGMRLHGRSA
jgi:hypothetical protein